MSTLLSSDGTPANLSNIGEMEPELAFLASGMHLIGMSDGNFWHHPMAVQASPQGGIGFSPALMFFKDLTKIPAPKAGENGVLCLGKPDPVLGKAYSTAYLNLKAAFAGIVTASQMPPVDMGALSSLNISGGRR
jgi:hypothetical protein